MKLLLFGNNKRKRPCHIFAARYSYLLSLNTAEVLMLYSAFLLLLPPLLLVRPALLLPPLSPTAIRRTKSPSSSSSSHSFTCDNNPSGAASNGFTSSSSTALYGQNNNNKPPPPPPAGSFFNPIPENSKDDDDDDEGPADDAPDVSNNKNKDQILKDILQTHQQPPLSTQPSTINGIPSKEAGMGFGKQQKKETPPMISLDKKDSEKKKKTTKPYIGIGRPKLNDVTKPEYDDQGYTLYSNETTGEKSRVFEALVDYPCLFTMKIVGYNDGPFVHDMIGIVATTCNVVDSSQIDHSVKVNGKWTSVTIEAPVQDATMLYALYENVDKDPRVKFKF